jgi:aspartyl protease
VECCGVLLVCTSLSTTVSRSDTRFAAGKSAIAIPFQLVDNRIYLRASVNGSSPLRFILDTGANQNILSLRNAKSFAMRLQLVGKVEGGIGDEPSDAFLITDKVSIGLPGAVVSDQSLIAVSLDKTQECLGQTADNGDTRTAHPGQRSATRRAVDGILGKPFFSSFVVEIDYPALLINLYDPASYAYAGKGETLPLEMDPRLIFVSARVKATGRPPVPARLVVDTGAGALSLARHFAEAHRLLPPASKLTSAAECGISGSVKEPTLVGKLEILQLGGLKLSNPLTVFYQRATPYDGLLGGQFLRNFKAIFDYSRSRMILESRR